MSRFLGRDHHPLTPKRLTVVLVLLSVFLLVVSIFALSVGSVAITFGRVLAATTGFGTPEATDRLIILDIRLPRVLLAIIVGGGLSVAGAMLQALLRNPLAEPYILGISSGGTMGTILALGLSAGISTFTAPVASFAGSALVMFLVYGIARRHGQLDPYMLLLAGIMVGAFFNAAVLLTVSFFHEELRNVFLWLMGNLSGARFETLAVAGPLTLAACLPAFFLAKRYNLIATGDDAAAQLGVDVRVLRRWSYLLASVITGAVVSVSGVVGFVGLLIPHMCRILFGPDHRLLMPSSFLMGATFLVLADTLARTIIAPAEIPVGAVTAALGAPVFVYLLRRK